MGGGSTLESTTVILHDDARYRILKWLLQLGEVLNAAFDDLLAPLVDLILLIGKILSLFNNHLNSSLCNLLNLLRIEILVVV